MAASPSQRNISCFARREADGSRRVWLGARLALPVLIPTLAVLATGLITILDALLTRFPERRIFEAFLPFDVYHWSRLLTVAVGSLFIYLSFNLWQRRRVAWWIAVIGSVVMMLLFTRSDHWYMGLPPAVTLAVLVIFRKRFSVRSEPRSIAWGLVLFSIALGVAMTYGTVGFWLLDRRDFGIIFSPTDALRRTLREFALMGNNDLVAHTRHARWFLESLDTVGLLAGGFAAYSLFRPIAYRFAVLPHERETARRILQQYGRSPYDYFKVWSDKSYFFAPGHRSFISYRVALGVAIALGDPIGPDEELEELTRSFVSFCSDNGWLVCFLMPELIPIHRELGLSVFKVGEDAIVDLERFRAITSQKKYFRYVRRKFMERGYSAIECRSPHSPQLLDELETISNDWLSQPGHRDFGFFQGRFERSYISETPFFVVRESSGRAMAFVNEVPSFRTGEATFDMMRHRAGIPGIMDYLFSELMLTLRQEGYNTLNMGIAPMAGIGERPEATILEKAIHQIYERIRTVSTKGLRQYKQKFEPRWEERFLTYQGPPVELIRIAIAMSRVFEDKGK